MHPAARWVRELWPELVPGWWVLRGYLGVMIVAEVLNGVSGDDFLGSKLVGLAGAIAAVVGSVHLGRRGADGWRPRWVQLLDIAAVVGVLWGVLIGFGARQPEYVYVEDVHQRASGELTHPDGTRITNLYAYDDEGRLLDGVLLYDQDGTPVVVAPEGSTPYTDDGFPVETDYRLDVNGAEVPHAYPLDQRVEEWRSGPDGSERVVAAPVRPPAITTPRLAPDVDAPDVDAPDSSTTSSTSTTSPSTTSAPPTSQPESSAPGEPPPPPPTSG